MMNQTVARRSANTTSQSPTPSQGNNGSKNLGQCETLPSNTGLNSQKLHSGLEIRVDTVAIVCREVADEATALKIIGLCEKTFDDACEFNPGLPTTMGRRWDGHSTSSIRGLKFWWQAPNDDKPGQLYIYAGGATLAAATMRDTQDLFCYLSAAHAAECKRFDVALDDHDKTASFDEIVEAVKAGNYGYAATDQIISSGKRGEETRGVTVYLGSTKSDKLYRIYDKSIESGGLIDATRHEVQFRDKKAALAFEGFCDIDASAFDELAPTYLGALVTGAIRFCNRSSDDPNLERCPLLGWWQALIDKVAQGLRVPCKAVESSLEKKLAWIDRTVARTMAIAKKHFGDSFYAYADAVCAWGEERLTKKDYAILAMEST